MTTTQSSQAAPGTLPWWVLVGLTLGICYVLLGLLLIVLPPVSLMAILTFAGAAWFVSGAVDWLSYQFNLERLDPESPSFTLVTLVRGWFGIAAGVVVLFQPLARRPDELYNYVIILGFIGLAVGALRVWQGFLDKDLAVGIWGASTFAMILLLVVRPYLAVDASLAVVGAIALLGGAGAIAAVLWLAPGGLRRSHIKEEASTDPSPA